MSTTSTGHAWWGLVVGLMACGGRAGSTPVDAAPVVPDAAPPATWKGLAEARLDGDWFELRTPAASAPAPLGGGVCAIWRADYEHGAHVDAWPGDAVALAVGGTAIAVPVADLHFDRPPAVERMFYRADEDATEAARALLVDDGDVLTLVDCLAPDTAYRAQVRAGAGGPELWITDVGGAAEQFELVEGASHTSASGQRWRFDNWGHKHGGDGSTTGEWRLTVEKNGQTIDVHASGHPPYAEGAAFGQAFRIEELEGPHVRVSLSAGVRRPLSLEQASELARKRYFADGNPEPSSWNSSQHDGSFRLGFSPDAKGMMTIVIVGRHSGSIVSVRQQELGRGGQYQMRRK